MSSETVENLNVASQQVLITPEQLKAKIPLSEKAEAVISESRQVIQNILDGKDKRVFAVVGPCSIHDIFFGCNRDIWIVLLLLSQSLFF